MIWQLAETASDVPQFWLKPKSPGAGPESAMLLMLKASFPWFWSVTVCAALLVPTVWLENVRLEWDRLAMASLVVPFRATI